MSHGKSPHLSLGREANVTVEAEELKCCGILGNLRRKNGFLCLPGRIKGRPLDLTGPLLLKSFFLHFKSLRMHFFGDDSHEAEKHRQLTNGEVDKGNITHELIAAAASYEAARAYEKHVAENGQPQSHEQAKAIMAGFIGAFIDREVEAKALEFSERDKEKAKNAAKEKVEPLYTPDQFM
ncbi:hypothetical protein FS842_004160 [Serendipita sp. 407]|nr:hypothetical protein FS842_004160 [Serendipita sp. 407]